jgi:type II secretory pathway pseudopilin PulG
MRTLHSIRGGRKSAVRRQAFTLVELLVAAALIIFIMTILSEAFVAATKVFRDFKAIGDMNGRLRTALQLLREDLGSDHFEGQRRLSDPNFWTVGPPQQGFFRIWQQGNPPGATSTSTNALVLEGQDLEGLNSYTDTGAFLHFTVRKHGNYPQNFFMADVSQASTAGAEALIAPSLLTSPGTLGNYPPDSRYQDILSFANAASTFNQTTFVFVYKAQWAEIAYFLRPNGNTANGTTLYSLYRRQLVAMTDNNLNWTNPGPIAGTTITGYEEMSAKTDGTNIYFNSPADLTIPQRRFGMLTKSGSNLQLPSQQPPYAATPQVATTDSSYGGIPVATDGTYPIWVASTTNSYDQVYAGSATQFSKQGADIVLTDLLSFDIRILRPGDPDFVDLSNMTMNNTTFSNPLTTINGLSSTTVKVFDTWSSINDGTYDYTGWNATPPSSTTVPLQAQILAIKVSIRIWDFKTEQTRQASMVVPM